LRNTRKVLLGVAERADIVIDFAGYPLGTGCPSSTPGANRRQGTGRTLG
jgi:hypothetical protein